MSGWALAASQVKAIVKSSMLERLQLARCGIDDEMLQVLADGDAALASLELDDNPGITDRGLEPLLDLKGLRELSLRRCAKVTDAGIAALQRRRADLHIAR